MTCQDATECKMACLHACLRPYNTSHDVYFGQFTFVQKVQCFSWSLQIWQSRRALTQHVKVRAKIYNVIDEIWLAPLIEPLHIKFYELQKGRKTVWNGMLAQVLKVLGLLQELHDSSQGFALQLYASQLCQPYLHIASACGCHWVLTGVLGGDK